MCAIIYIVQEKGNDSDCRKCSHKFLSAKHATIKKYFVHCLLQFSHSVYQSARHTMNNMWSIVTEARDVRWMADAASAQMLHYVCNARPLPLIMPKLFTFVHFLWILNCFLTYERPYCPLFRCKCFGWVWGGGWHFLPMLTLASKADAFLDHINLCNIFLYRR